MYHDPVYYIKCFHCGKVYAARYIDHKCKGKDNAKDD